METKSGIISHYNRPIFFFSWSLIIPTILWGITAWLSHQPKQTIIMEWLEMILAIVGLITPISVSLYLFSKDKVMMEDLKARLKLRKIPLKAIAIIIGLTFGSISLSQLISIPFGYSWEQFHISGQPSFQSFLISAWFTLIFAAIVEELAWHTYGTDALRAKFNLFTTSIIFTVYWALWHLPLGFIKGYYHSQVIAEGALISANFVISLFLFVFIMNWLYYKFGRNVWISILFHLCANIGNEIFATHPNSKVIQSVLFFIFVVVILCKDKKMFFRRGLKANNK